jgi:hypothetical protein
VNPSATPETLAPPVEACYVYGIVSRDTTLPDDLRGVGDPAGNARLIPHRRIAALVSNVHTDRPIGTRNDLLGHERVLDRLAAETVVLPMRFGAVLSGPDAVRNELLAPHHDLFATALFEFADSAQFTVKGRYVQDTVLREVLAEQPRLLELREKVRSLPSDASYYDRIRLGELLAQAFAQKRQTDGAQIVDELVRYAIAVSVHEPVTDDGVVDAAFLVEREHFERFERAAEELGKKWAERVRLRLLGPLALYDFVPKE